MQYEYAGYLGRILYAPEGGVTDPVDAVTFGVPELAQWNTRDLPSDLEWQGIPAQRVRSEECVRLSGRFDDQRRIDNIPVDRAGFWVSLSSLGWRDERFPVDLEKFPVLEVTYRCASDNAAPRLVWTYPGGRHVAALSASRVWRTVARIVPHSGFPATLDALIIRLYSTARTSEALEIKSVRFRSMTPAETEAVAKDTARLAAHPMPRIYPVLEQFLPMGVRMDAASCRRQAGTLGISLSEYISLAMEDIVKHHHNTIAMDNVLQLSGGELKDLLDQAGQSGVKVVMNYELSGVTTPEEWGEMMRQHIAPLVDNESVLAWRLCGEATEENFHDQLALRATLEDIDPNHPMVMTCSYPSAFPLFARHFAVGGFSVMGSHSPWDMGTMVRTHIDLFKGRQLWVEGPAHVYATGTPEWSSCPEMRLMVNLAFANGARGWFNHSYHNDPIWSGGTYERSLTGPFLAFSDLWSELDICMTSYNALAPMFLFAHPVPTPPIEYLAPSTAQENAQLPQGLPPTDTYHLRGSDYRLYIVISNDIRGISALNISIPREALKGNEIYDLTDFVRSRRWEQMELVRHVEMFPGQARVVMVASPEVCAYYRDAISRRLAEDDQRQYSFDLGLAETYRLDTTEVQNLAACADGRNDVDKLDIMDRARDSLVNLLYATPAVADARSGIIEATAAVCACDGALCRMVGRGKSDKALELGMQVTPLAREITHLRIELRQGNGESVADHSKDLARRAYRMLESIRSMAKPPASPNRPGSTRAFGA
jgi:hypothetical protein